jgi:tetratricopeptide (TPR) repeat protein
VTPTPRIYQNSVHVIGLGSAGTNIVETFLACQKTRELLESDLTRLSLLAIDIADPEIRSLQETNEKISKALAKSGIPRERMRLIAQSVKFPTAEAMFDFINQKYNEYLVGEGCRLEKFIPWLNSTMAIPPMAGGAGRRRALAKAIYALNYYQLGIIRNCINAFKEQALSSIVTPTIVLVYGLGGGTGSGVFFDFARHLRKVLGSGVPIIAFVVTPCGGDDPPAKGCSAFVSMNELQLLTNKDYNEFVTKAYGEYYRNPLNALIYLPLLPAYTKVGNIITARREMDEMVTDLLYVLMDFDLADLMGGIGTEVGLTDNSAHTLGMIKVMYPVDDYITAFKVNFEKLQLLHDQREEKLEILDAIQQILEECNHEVRNIYKNYLIKTGTYNEEQFEEKVKSVIYSNPRLEDDMTLHVKGVEIQARNWIDELRKFLSTVRRMGKVGPIEEAVIDLALHKDGSRKMDSLESILVNLSKTHLEFCERKAQIFERLKQLIPSSQVFTVRQKRVLEDFMNLAEVAEKSLNLLRFYDHTRYLADTLTGYCEVLPEAEADVKELKEIHSELATIYLAVQLMLRTPSDEAKMIEEHVAYLNAIVSKRLEKRNIVDNEAMRVQESKRRKEFDRSKMEAQLRKTFGSKRYAREQLIGIERDLKRINEEEAYALENLEKMDNAIKMYDTLAKKMSITSDYRKRLNKIVDLYNEYEERLRQIIEPKKYFERSTELTENEQMKIIFKILMEQEETLTREKTLKEIVDLDHYRDYMKSLIRVFKTPSVMGYKPVYKSDYIWVTVQAPPNLWSEELNQELYTALAGYVTSEVSRTITVRVVESRDPWITRILVVGGRGKPEDMEAYDEMQLLYNKSNDFERHLSRSMLIEHGISAKQIVDYIKNNNNNNNQKK